MERTEHVLGRLLEISRDAQSCKNTVQSSLVANKKLRASYVPYPDKFYVCEHTLKRQKYFEAPLHEKITRKTFASRADHIEKK